MEESAVSQEKSLSKLFMDGKFKGINLIYICSCIVIVLASFFPYVHSNQKTMSLMESSDGVFFLMLSVLMVIFIVYERKKTVVILGIVQLYLCVYELVHTYSVMSKTGEAISLKMGYFILLAGTVILLVAVGSFIYQNGLKQQISKLFERISPIKETKE